MRCLAPDIYSQNLYIFPSILLTRCQQYARLRMLVRRASTGNCAASSRAMFERDMDILGSSLRCRLTSQRAVLNQEDG